MSARGVMQAVAMALENAQRQGAVKDEPEGARYIQLSDTLATTLAGLLRQAAAAQDSDDKGEQ